MKILISYSGGKDSQSSLIMTVNKYGPERCEAVFCDTGHENPLTYKHIKETTDLLGVKLVILKGRYSFADLARKKKRFPSKKTRFCTEELKIYPMIDYILTHKENLLIIQGIRGSESPSRAKMKKQCTFFKYYFEPFNKRGDRFTYRKKEVIHFNHIYNADIERPVFDWTSQEVINYIIANRQTPNPLYYLGFARVGCFPCIMATHRDILEISTRFEDHINKLKDLEKEVGSSFFGPGYIPSGYIKGDQLSIEDVVNYIKSKNGRDNLSLFGEDPPSCSSFYHLCE